MRRGLELRVQAGEHLDAAGLFSRQLADILALEGGEFGVLLVERLLCVGELALEELGGAFGGVLVGLGAFAQEERGDLAADGLRGARIVGGEGDEEAGQATGVGDHRVNGLNADALARHLQPIVHAHFAGAVQVIALDDGLNAGAAEDLFAHRGQAAVEVGGDDRRHVVARHLLLIDENESL